MSLEARLRKLEALYGKGRACNCGNAKRTVIAYEDESTGRPDWRGQSIEPCKRCSARPKQIVIAYEDMRASA